MPEFKKEEHVFFDYMGGRIEAFTEPLPANDRMREKGHTALINIWYFKNNYGIGHFLVGFGVSDGLFETITSHLKRLLDSGYFEDFVIHILKEIQEYDEWSENRISEFIMNTKK
jgi:hypothetical protein